MNKLKTFQNGYSPKEILFCQVCNLFILLSEKQFYYISFKFITVLVILLHSRAVYFCVCLHSFKFVSSAYYKICMQILKFVRIAFTSGAIN